MKTLLIDAAIPPGASHLRVLVSALCRTQGSVIEFGSELYRTSIAYEMCRAQHRPFTSIETNKPWHELITSIFVSSPQLSFLLQGPTITEEKLIQQHMEKYGQIGFAIIDHTPLDPGTQYPYNRMRAVHACKKYNAAVILCHDTEPERSRLYGWERTAKDDWEDFLYVNHYSPSDGTPHTTLLSNVVDVRGWVYP